MEINRNREDPALAVIERAFKFGHNGSSIEALLYLVEALALLDLKPSEEYMARYLIRMAWGCIQHHANEYEEDIILPTLEENLEHVKMASSSATQSEVLLQLQNQIGVEWTIGAELEKHIHRHDAAAQAILALPRNLQANAILALARQLAKKSD